VRLSRGTCAKNGRLVAPGSPNAMTGPNNMERMDWSIGHASMWQ
jgi:hypothetical protein